MAGDSGDRTCDLADVGIVHIRSLTRLPALDLSCFPWCEFVMWIDQTMNSSNIGGLGLYKQVRTNVYTNASENIIPCTLL